MKLNYDTKEPNINSNIWNIIQHHPALLYRNKRKSTPDSRTSVVSNILKRNNLNIFSKMPIILEIDKELFWFRMSYMREIIDIKDGYSIQSLPELIPYFRTFCSSNDMKSGTKRRFYFTGIRCIVITCNENDLDDVINTFDQMGKIK